LSITALPTPPQRSDPANFPARGDAFMAALPTFATEANTLQADVNAKQITASAAATSATTSATNALASENAAAASSNATIWVSGTTYAVGNVRFSPINFQSYRRKTAGAGTTDPSLDQTNWQPINSTLVLLATVSPTSVSSINFLTVFGSQYDNYIIECTGLDFSTAASLQMTFANSGTLDTGAFYGMQPVSTTSITSNTNVISFANLTAANSGNAGLNSTIKVSNVNSTKLKSISIDISVASTPNTIIHNVGHGTYINTNAISGFSIYPSSGTFIAQGKIRVYGINNF